MKPVTGPSRKTQWLPRNSTLAGLLLLAALFAGLKEARGYQQEPVPAQVQQLQGLQQLERLQQLQALQFRIRAIPLGNEALPIPDEAAKESPKIKFEPGTVEVRFADDSVIKLMLREEKVEIVTAYGKLLVPVIDIQRIEFATRLSEADSKRIPVLIGNLGSTDFATRDSASDELLKLQCKAYPALVEAAKHADPEVVRRANDLLDKIRDAVPKESLETRPHDVLYTEDSKITGRISNTTLKAITTQFGEVQLKLVDMRSLRSPAATDPAETQVVNAQPAPQTLQALQQQIGQTYTFRLMGTVQGSLWGTGVYTLDSTLGMAAVHAGILKSGQTGVVKVKILPSPPAFQGSTRNGVTSDGFGAFPAAFQFVR